LIQRTIRHSHALAIFLVTVDVALLTASAYIATCIHPNLECFPGIEGLTLSYVFGMITVFVCWITIGWTSGMYYSHRQDPLAYQMWLVLRAALLTTGTSYAIVSFATGSPPQIEFSMAYFLSALVVVGAFRLLFCIGLWYIRVRGFNPRHILIVGANERAANLVMHLHAKSRLGLRVLGVLDDDPERAHYLDELGVEYLGGLDTLDDLLGRVVIDEVHVCLPVRSCYEKIHELADECLTLGVSMRLIADLFPLQLATARLHHIEGIPMLSMAMPMDFPGRAAFKRVVDIIGATAAILLLSPVFIVTAILIKVTSPGPIFFVQERVGMNNRRFNMLKFRSMVQDAELKRDEIRHLNEVDGPIFKIKQDPRITSIGRFIRKYSIDEMPQLINVLLGDMSLVGPRPHPVKEVAEYGWHHRRRLCVKPGMTGLAQVNGRSNLQWENTVELDLAYIDTWTPWLDLTIAIRTIRAVLSAQGAT